MRFEEIKKNKEILAFMKKGNENLGILGYTDHSEAHCMLVAERAGDILKKLGYEEKEIELANEFLKSTDMPLEDRVTVVSAIGNHDETTGGATDCISAALIIADKTDVRRNRVRNKDMATFDIHDRVNYAVTEAKLKVHTEKKVITLGLHIDENICTMYEYFDIFLGRMMMCRRAAEILGLRFKLTANGSKVL